MEMDEGACPRVPGKVGGSEAGVTFVFEDNIAPLVVQFKCTEKGVEL